MAIRGRPIQREKQRPEADDEVVLTGHLQGFRSALKEEVEAARRASASGATQLINGKRIGQVGEAFQYSFSVETALQVPEDSPGDLMVAGHAPCEAAVISVQGMTVTLSLRSDFGDYIPRAALRTNMAYLLRKLIERVEGYSEKPNPAGDRLLGLEANWGERKPLPLDGLNESQRLAVEAAFGFSTSFIHGPPGTGKTQTIGKIGERVAREGQSALLVSHTNSAVDQALMRIADALGEDLVDGSILRLGIPTDLRLRDPKNKRLLAQTHIDERSAELAARRDQLKQERIPLKDRVVELQHQLEIAEWIAISRSDLTDMKKRVTALSGVEAEIEQLEAHLIAEAREVPELQDRLTVANQFLDRESTRDQLNADLATSEAKCKAIRSDQQEQEEVVKAAASLLAMVNETSGLVRMWKKLPKPEEQQDVLSNAQRELERIQEAAHQAELVRNACQAQLQALDRDLAVFGEKYSGTPEEVRAGTDARLRARRRYQEKVALLRREYRRDQSEISEQLNRWLDIMESFHLGSEERGTVAQMFSAVEAARDLAAERLGDVDVATLRSQVDDLNGQIRRLDSELASIEEAMRHVEEEVVRDAKVIATTLTRAYLRDSVQKRRFDMVVLDEASMAPIPALWVAAGVSDHRCVVVGDPKQLAPIVQSSHDDAQLWLGRYIFEASSVLDEQTGALVQLNVQHRMHPAISAIPNQLVYDNSLSDGEGLENDGSLLDGWFNPEWGYDHPVLLVDTESSAAWVTSVKGSARSSRLNFLSATVAVDLASQMLLEGRPQVPPGGAPRILIATPYKPQAKLLKLLLREQGIDGEVEAGTAHTFQGKEAPIVILDLVVDEPHWKVGLFIPEFDANTQRLMNVALTRAQRRLVVIGDFKWILKNTKPHAFMNVLISLLKGNAPSADAKAILPNGLAARAAQAHLQTFGGTESAKDQRVVVDQTSFYKFLIPDISNAKSTVILYSPFMTQNRVSMLQPHLRAAVERGVDVYVITKTREERGKRELPPYRVIEEALTEWGVHIIHKFHMHEKIVMVDDDILWFGSLNPLSFSDTQEIMERRASKSVLDDFARTLRIQDLIATLDQRCPVCESELVPAEGKDDPFYLKCVEPGCHTRSIGDPAPTNGVLPCPSCGGSPYFGSWGDVPHWRCEENPKHRTKVHRNHLKLPKMKALVPKRELRRLEKLYGM